MVRDLPGELRNLLTMLQAGRFGINVNVTDLRETIEYVFYRVDKVVNRLIIGIILAAMLMGSSLILRGVEEGGGTPAFAVISFLVSFLVGLYLIYSIFKSGKV